MKCKRGLAVMFLTVILGITVNADYSTAYASGTITNGLAKFVETIETAGGTIEGVSLGGMLGIAFSVASLGYAVKYPIDNWNDPDYNTMECFQDCIKNGSQGMKDWWSKLCDEAVFVGDGVTKAGDTLKNALDFPVWDYIIPKGKSVTIPSNIAAEFAEYIAKKYQYAKYAPGHYTNINDKVQNVFKTCNITMDGNGFYDFKYIAIIADVSAGLAFNVYASNNKFNCAKYRTQFDQIFYTLSGKQMNVYYYQSGAFTRNVYFDQWTSSNISLGLANTQKTYFTNFDLYNDENVLLHKSDEVTYDLLKSDYGYTGSNADVYQKDGQTINIDDYLTGKLKGLNIDNGITTDDIIKAVRGADIAAGKDGAKVLSIPIDATGEDAKASDKADTIADSVADAIEGVMTKVFIPDKAVVAEFVDDMNYKVNNSTGILTFPLALVIKFLNGVLTLGTSDCILKIPPIDFNGHHLYDGMDFNFTDYVNESKFKTIYGIYKVVVDAILIIGVLELAQKKGSEIVRGN